MDDIRIATSSIFYRLSSTKPATDFWRSFLAFARDNHNVAHWYVAAVHQAKELGGVEHNRLAGRNALALGVDLQRALAGQHIKGFYAGVLMWRVRALAGA